MKKINLLIALSIGIISSASGMIQVGAATYNYFVDFATKEVANFSAYNQSFNVDTYDLEGRLNFKWTGSYRYDACPTAFTTDLNWRVNIRLNGLNPIYNFTQPLPNFICTTTNTTFTQESSIVLPDNFIQYVINDDTNFLEINSELNIAALGGSVGRTLYLVGYRNYFDLSYDFDTTYLFNKFLSDQNYVLRSTSGSGTWTFGATQTTYLGYVYTTAGNDAYYINNSNVASIGTTRKKYAIDYNNEFFRGESIGAQFTNNFTGTDQVLMSPAGNINLNYRYNYYYLNSANLAQAIVDAPVFNFDYEDCGSFLALNVGCFINNGLAYITNDAPIISDTITLLNAGIELAAQTFGIIGNFADDNIFGFLILVGFGFIAVKWLLKND